MNDVPKGAARNPESDGDPARIGDIQNSAKWEDRLARRGFAVLLCLQSAIRPVARMRATMTCRKLQI